MAKFNVDSINKTVGAISDKKNSFSEGVNFKFIDISLIKENEYNDKVFRDTTEDEFNNLAESIKEVGVLNPLVVVKEEGTDFYKLISGEKRKRVLEDLKIKNVPVIIKSFENENKEKLALIHANIKQRKLSDMDLARAIEQEKEILKAMGYEGNKIEKIAENYNLSKSTAKRIDKLNSLIPELKKLIDEEKLKAGKGQELAKLDEKMQLKIYEILNENIEEMTLSELKKFTEKNEKEQKKLLNKIQDLKNKNEKTEEEKLNLQNKIEALENEIDEQKLNDVDENIIKEKEIIIQKLNDQIKILNSNLKNKNEKIEMKKLKEEIRKESVSIKKYCIENEIEIEKSLVDLFEKFNDEQKNNLINLFENLKNKNRKL